MTVTLDIKPEMQAGLLAMAEASGLSLQQYIFRMVENSVRAPSPLTPEERAARWVESAKRFPNTPPLSDADIGRDTIYGERG